jgi:hypothetical protein
MDWDIVYPVMLLGRFGIHVTRDSDELTIRQKSLMGMYNDRLMVDSVGRATRVKEAREPGNDGGLLIRLREFWNPSRQFRVDLVFDSEIKFDRPPRQPCRLEPRLHKL